MVTTRLAAGTLVQNVGRPYIIVTLKNYADASQGDDFDGMDGSPTVSGSLARAGVEKTELVAPLDGTIRSQSIMGTKFALENMMFEDEGFDMSAERHPRLTKHTTAPPEGGGGMLD